MTLSFMLIPKGCPAQRGRLTRPSLISARPFRSIPGLSPLGVSMGGILVDVGRWEEAIAACSEAIRLDPANADAHAYPALR